MTPLFSSIQRCVSYISGPHLLSSVRSIFSDCGFLPSVSHLFRLAHRPFELFFPNAPSSRFFQQKVFAVSFIFFPLSHSANFPLRKLHRMDISYFPHFLAVFFLPPVFSSAFFFLPLPPSPSTNSCRSFSLDDFFYLDEFAILPPDTLPSICAAFQRRYSTPP